MRRLLALWPIITFALVTAVDEAGIQLGIPHGTLTIIGEVGLSVWIALQIKSRVEGRLKWLLVAPLGFALGDLAYGLNHYVFQYIYKSSLGPMSYAIPYLVAMAATIYWLVMLCREQG
ncbi:MAG: hypothetical protein HY074_07900 [Deltaproteobacteria bacterium]|nr:hypothetical protein [Deltaproteobacteria bacterium]